jgi:hypothetical protein
MVQPSVPSPHYSTNQYCIMKIIAPGTEILICPVFWEITPFVPATIYYWWFVKRFDHHQYLCSSLISIARTSQPSQPRQLEVPLRQIYYVKYLAKSHSRTPYYEGEALTGRW